MADVDNPDLNVQSGNLIAPGEADGIHEIFLQWVIKHFSRIEYVHTDKRAPWCPEWWKHSEVVERLWCVWQARLQAEEDSAVRLDALSEWWLTHWDRHAAVLFDSHTGPFRKCDRNLGHFHDTEAQPTHTVPVTRPPASWRPDL